MGPSVPVRSRFEAEGGIAHRPHKRPALRPRRMPATGLAARSHRTAHNPLSCRYRLRALRFWQWRVAHAIRGPPVRTAHCCAANVRHVVSTAKHNQELGGAPCSETLYQYVINHGGCRQSITTTTIVTKHL